MTDNPRMREMYRDYLNGRMTFDDLKRATDKAASAYEQSPRGTEGTRHPDSERSPRGLVVEEAREHAYLIARGVRPLAIVGHCTADPQTMFEIASQLENVSCAGAIPFVATRDDGVADYGYAGSRWAIELLRWAQSDAVPDEHRHRIIGLLLGYSVEAIRVFEEQNCGRLFAEPTRSGTGST